MREIDLTTEWKEGDASAPLPADLEAVSDDALQRIADRLAASGRRMRQELKSDQKLDR